MTRGINQPIIETVGLEYEFAQVPLKAVQRLAPDSWRVVRDGSCTTDGLMLGDNLVEEVDANLARFTRQEMIGGELVSPTFNMESDYTRYVEELVRIIDLLVSQHEHLSDLTGIHVHICVGEPPAYAIKNLLRLWVALEAVLYRISVAEHPRHRGASHCDYMYCRPLTGDGPQFVKDECGSYRRCFDLQKILDNATTTNEILRAFGRCDFRPSKWMPYRYYGLNIAPILIFGTVEFRIFNQTLVPQFIKAWVELCRAMVRIAYMDMMVSHLPPFPLGSTTPTGVSKFNFEDLYDYIPESLISQGAWQSLEKLFLMSSWQPACGPQVNHLVRQRERTVPLDVLPGRLLPEIVDKNYIQSIWNTGYEGGNQ